MRRHAPRPRKTVPVPRGARGAAAVETAISLPILLVAGLGVMQISLLSVSRAAVSYAAYAAARAALVADVPTKRGIDPARAARVALLPVTGPTTGPLHAAAMRALPPVLGRAQSWGGGIATLPARWRAAERKSVANVQWEGPWAHAEVRHDAELALPVAGPLLATLWRWTSDAPAEDLLRAASYGAPHIVLHDRCTLPAPWRQERRERREGE